MSGTLPLVMIMIVWLGVVSADELPGSEISRPGIVVEEVGERSALAKAGIQPGDVLLSWRRLPSPPANPEAAQGQYVSIFDWVQIGLEQAPRGTLEINARRGIKELTFRLEPGTLEAQVHPNFEPEELVTFRRCRGFAKSGEYAEASSCLETLALSIVGNDDVSCWLLLSQGKVWFEQADWEKAISAYRAALSRAGGAYPRSASWLLLGEGYQSNNEFEPAREAYESARAIRLKEPGEQTLIFSETLNQLGFIADLQGDLEQAESFHGQALEIRRKQAPGSLVLSLSLNNLGVAALYRGELDAAWTLLEQSLKIRRQLAKGSLEEAEALDNIGAVYWGRGDFDQAFDVQYRALEIRQVLIPESLSVARSLSNVGAIATARDDFDQAAELHRKALAISQKIAPGGLEVGQSFNNLGIIAYRRGDLEHATERFIQARDIYQILAPESLDVAYCLSYLSAVASASGDYDQALEHDRRALKIRQKLAPGSGSVAASNNGIGYTAWQLGDLDLAQDHYGKALEIMIALGRENFQMAHYLHNLGTVAHWRGNLEQATAYYQRALNIKHQVAPDSLAVAVTLNKLGAVAREQRNLERATDLSEQAFKIQEKVAPASLDTAKSLDNLGAAASESGDHSRALEAHLKALEIKEELGPESLDVAHTLYALGLAALNQGDPKRAEGFLARSLVIRRKSAVNSLGMADSLTALARIAHANGDLARARDFYERSLKIWLASAPDHIGAAETLYFLGTLYLEKQPPRLKIAGARLGDAIDTLERQLAQLGGSHRVRGLFRGGYHQYYQYALAVERELGRPERAFHYLERSRARSFMEQLAERDTVMDTDIPEALDNRRRRLAVRFDRVQQDLAELDTAEDAGAIEAHRDRLRGLQAEAEEIEQRIRQSSPHLASLQYPRPLELEAVRATLDPGTLLLSYSVGETSTVLFATSRQGSLISTEIELGQAELGKKVQRFRGLIIDDSRIPGGRLRSLDTLAESLYASLLEPVAEQLVESERIVILADGPLHYLPWGALRSGGINGVSLIEQKPFHLAMSATVYADLVDRRSTATPSISAPKIAIFGDPRYPSPDVANTSDDWVVRSTRHELFNWDPLPHTRREAESIAQAFPPGDVKVFIGVDASEQNARALGKDVDILHFATHAHLDEHLPTSSFLALTLPEHFKEGQENGLLQVWEIYERLRIDAELVVLSACQTAMGEQQRGEGLIGLTRAFQYAGARTVLASLWNVNDRRTAELMVRFYQHLRAGKSKDEALRAAQLELLKGPIQVTGSSGQMIDASAPYYWAAFQLYGDWQ